MKCLHQAVLVLGTTLLLLASLVHGMTVQARVAQAGQTVLVRQAQAGTAAQARVIQVVHQAGIN